MTGAMETPPAKSVAGNPSFIKAMLCIWYELNAYFLLIGPEKGLQVLRWSFFLFSLKIGTSHILTA